VRLSKDESRAIAFVLGLVALAAIARVAARPRAADIPPAAELDAAALELESGAALEREQARARPLGAEERIDVNGAGAEELDRLPGVGAGLAERIIAERERAGAFDSAADLRAVAGLGGALLSRLEPHLAFGPGTGLARREHPALPAPAAERERAGGRDGAVASEGGERSPQTRARELAGSPSRRPAVPPSPLDPDRATAAELEALPGIGPALAARIVAKRDSLHGFRGVDDLRKVRGIGPATLERLRPFFRD